MPKKIKNKKRNPKKRKQKIMIGKDLIRDTIGKKRYIKKIKEMIGQDLVQDTVGTNQLLRYNQLITVLTSPVQYDEPRYNRYATKPVALHISTVSPDPVAIAVVIDVSVVVGIIAAGTH
jgi:hypothetical protein